jgi:dienelactone hydrolase
MPIQRRLLVTRSSLLLCLLLSCALSAPSQQPPSPRVLDLTSPDGTKLKATYFASARPGPGVILFHQCNRQRKVWDDLAQRLATSGINVLTLDFRGFGESAGTPLDKLTPEQVQDVFDEKFPADADTAYRYLAFQPGVNASFIGAGGASCGVNQSVQLARRHPEVVALVLLSEGTDADGRNFLRKKASMPLFLAVADDDPDPAVTEIMEWLFTLSSNPANKFEHYQKGGHGVEMFEAHPQLPEMIVAWYDSQLKSSPSPSAAAKSPAPASPEDRFLNQLDQPGAAANAAQLYAQAHKRDPSAVLFSEPLMNRLGYEHLQTGDTKGAIELFKLNVLVYPNSPNVYDSLSDAYLADGQKDLARQNAKKALELLPSNTIYSADYRKGLQENAEKKLKQLGDTPHQN